MSEGILAVKRMELGLFVRHWRSKLKMAARQQQQQKVQKKVQHQPVQEAHKMIWVTNSTINDPVDRRTLNVAVKFNKGWCLGYINTKVHSHTAWDNEHGRTDEKFTYTVHCRDQSNKKHIFSVKMWDSDIRYTDVKNIVGTFSPMIKSASKK